MNTYLDCIPCFFRQALFAARAATEDERKAKQILDRIPIETLAKNTIYAVRDIPIRNDATYGPLS